MNRDVFIVYLADNHEEHLHPRMVSRSVFLREPQGLSDVCLAD